MLTQSERRDTADGPTWVELGKWATTTVQQNTFTDTNPRDADTQERTTYKHCFIAHGGSQTHAHQTSKVDHGKCLNPLAH